MAITIEYVSGKGLYEVRRGTAVLAECLYHSQAQLRAKQLRSAKRRASLRNQVLERIIKA